MLWIAIKWLSFNLGVGLNMFPINPRELQKQLRQLKKLGIEFEQVTNVKKASIELDDKILVFENPEVFVIEFGSQKMFYIIPQNIREEPKTIQKPVEMGPSTSIILVPEEDIHFVAEYLGVSLEKAREALIKAGGDIAKAIEIIESEKKSAQ